MDATSNRRETFLTSRKLYERRCELSNAGYFYEGPSDSCCCFSCGVSTSNWTPTERAFVRHARTSERCPYLIREKGKDFIRIVRLYRGAYNPPPRPCMRTIPSQLIDEVMDLTVVQAALSNARLNLRYIDVRAAAAYRIRHYMGPFQTIVDIVKTVDELAAKQENEQR